MDQRAVAQLVERVRRRVRLGRALDLAVRVAMPAAAVALAVLLTYKLGFLSRWWAARALAGLTALPILGGIVGALRRVRREQAAKKADDACGLADRLTSALAFQRADTSDPFIAAQLRDAAAHAGSADARVAAPIALPGAESRALLVLLIAITAIAMLHIRGCAGGPNGIIPTAKLGGAKIEGAPELVAEIAADARKLDDPELQKLADEIQALLKKYEQGEISRKELFQKLAELEQKYAALKEGDFEALKEKLRKAGEELAKEQPTREAGKALQKDDLDKAKKQLEELAKKIGEGKDLKATEKSLKNAAEKMQRQLQDENKQMEARKRSLDDQKRELDKLSRDEKNEEKKRQLEDQKRELERLQREQQKQVAQRQQQQRQLERLSRSMSDAAQQMQNGNRQGAQQQMQQSAQQVARMADEFRRAAEGQRVKVQMMDLKEMVRRAGQQGDGKDGKGKQGKMGEFLARANGQGDGKGGDKGYGKGGKSSDLIVENEKGDIFILDEHGKPTLFMPTVRSGSPSESPGQQQGQQQQQPGRQPGDGIGNEHDPNLQGDATKLNSQKRDVSVEGKQGPGPTRSEVIYGAADKGFSQRNYKRVYNDYSNVVEEVMSREQVPLGMRYYVNRYFNLIKPRE